MFYHKSHFVRSGVPKKTVLQVIQLCLFVFGPEHSGPSKQLFSQRDNAGSPQTAPERHAGPSVLQGIHGAD